MCINFFITYGPSVLNKRLYIILFWYWVWLEMGKPYNGVAYDLMKCSRHTYHYSVRRVKKEK